MPSLSFRVRQGISIEFKKTFSEHLLTGINGLSTFQKYSNERKIKIVANEMIPLTNDIENIDVR